MAAWVEKVKGGARAGLSMVITLALAGIVIVAVLWVGILALNWMANGRPDHLICKGTLTSIFNEERTRYPNAQLGIELTEPTWFGATVFDIEPTYDYSLNALPLNESASAISEVEFGLSFTTLTENTIMGDETDTITGRTMLYADSLNRYIGLSNLNERDTYTTGYNFDGFCEEA